MIDQAIAASAASVCPSLCADNTIDGKTVLGWAFGALSINFAIFSLIYGVYASAEMAEKSHLGIVPFLKLFCGVIAAVIVILFALVIHLSRSLKAPLEVFTIAGCVGLISVLSTVLVVKMLITPPDP